MTRLSDDVNRCSFMMWYVRNGGELTATFEVARRRPLRVSAVACGLAASATLLLRSMPVLHQLFLLALAGRDG